MYKKMIIGATAFMIALVILMISFERYPLLLLVLAGITIWVVKENKKYQAAKIARDEEVEEIRMNSIVFMIRHALNGLIVHLGLPNVAGYGYINIVSTQIQGGGIAAFKVRYGRLPNSNIINPQTVEYYRCVINNFITFFGANLIYPENTVFVNCYVYRIIDNGTELQFMVIPNICAQSRAFIEAHIAQTQRQNIYYGTDIPQHNNITELDFEKAFDRYSRSKWSNPDSDDSDD
jgi:hypothetical protein